MASSTWPWRQARILSRLHYPEGAPVNTYWKSGLDPTVPYLLLLLGEQKKWDGLLTA